MHPNILVLLVHQPIVLLKTRQINKDRVDAVVDVYVAVELVRDDIDRLQLVRVPRRNDDLIWVALSIPLDPRQVPDVVEEGLVEDYGVVGAVVDLRHLAVLSHAYTEELVQGYAVLLVFLRQDIRRAHEEDLTTTVHHMLAAVTLSTPCIFSSDHYPFLPEELTDMIHIILLP